MKRIVWFVALLLMAGFHSGFSQVGVGQWRDHLPYSAATHVVEAGDRIYCAAGSSLFYFDRQDNSLGKKNKVNGLSDVGITGLGYDSTSSTLIIGYSNGNLDLVLDDEVVNISDIKRKLMPGKKSINHILVIQNLAFLSCGFGIVVVNISKQEIKDTYQFGPGGGPIEVRQLAFDGLWLTAATELGLFKADINHPNLADYSNWFSTGPSLHLNDPFRGVIAYHGALLALLDGADEQVDSVFVRDGTSWIPFPFQSTDQIYSVSASGGYLSVCREFNLTVYNSLFEPVRNIWTYGFSGPRPSSTCFDREGVLWIADRANGLVRNTGEMNSERFLPNGPASHRVLSMASSGNVVWAVSGGYNASWGNTFTKDGAYSFSENSWRSFNKTTTEGFHNEIWDLTSVAIDPSDTGHVYVGAWGGAGILEFQDSHLQEIFNDSNSSLQTIFPGYFCKIGGMASAGYGRRWVSNAGVSNPISVRLADGTWKSLPFGSDINAETVGSILVTQSGSKWVILPKGLGLFAFNEKGTWDNFADDSKRKFSITDENGKIITNEVYSIAEDRDGSIWVGTNQGVVVFYSPQNVYSGQNFYAQRPIVPITATTGQYLLKSDKVTAIAVDGANRKWIGTEGSGAFLVSSDGTAQLQSFNASNSPLLSDNVQAITINQVTGEVYFGTDKGIVSYRGTATEPEPEFDEIFVFPNPVRETYQGPITLKGLVADSNVKITDVGGNLVFETVSLGGQAVWDGRNFEGRRVPTGVYLVFCSNSDGSKTQVGRLLFIH